MGDLKTKVNKITSENAERLSFAESLNLSPPNDENGTEGTYISSQTTSILPPQTSLTNHTDLPIANGSIAHHKSVSFRVRYGIYLPVSLLSIASFCFSKIRSDMVR